MTAVLVLFALCVWAVAHGWPLLALAAGAWHLVLVQTKIADARREGAVELVAKLEEAERRRGGLDPDHVIAQRENAGMQ